jgi:hypothetical protein
MFSTVFAQRQTSPYRSVGGFVTGASEVLPDVSRPESELSFICSDTRMVEGFNWAKQQALSYVFSNDLVGPWYEAVEPGREGFCMRDVAHQAMGAHVLGLQIENLNMLYKFAENISDSRDWCSLWEIDQYNRPAPVDYASDNRFWYNLPANFDILDCCFRMYVWTGNLKYVNDPVFLNFYDRTVNEYVERWGLDINQVMHRPRLLNVRGILNPDDRFQMNRGIPGYNEGDIEYVVGIDLLATQYLAYKAYAFIQGTLAKKELTGIYEKKAAEVRSLVNNKWWNNEEQYFFDRLDKDYHLTGRSGMGLLYREIVDDGPKLKSFVNTLKGGRSVEAIYKYGSPDEATERMVEIAKGIDSRREYPEVPFSWMGTLVNGTMGITIDASPTIDSWEVGYWVEAIVKTLPGLGTKIQWAELNNLPIRRNKVSVRHDGNRKTTLINQNGPALIWCPAFPGTFNTLIVNGKHVKASIEDGTLGRKYTWIRVVSGAGGKIVVEVP